MKDDFDIVVIGAGAAGCMAAIEAGRKGKKVLLLERNSCLGKKILLTSNGRCNFTNTASMEDFFKKIRPRGEFYRTAFQHFFNNDTIDFFRSLGVDSKVEDRGRVITAGDDAHLITAALVKALGLAGVSCLYEKRISTIKKDGDIFTVAWDGGAIQADKVILAAGGASYPATGSSGDSFALARALGHTVTPLAPALSPLKLRENYLKDIQGIAFSDVTLSWGKKNVSAMGDILFTHFGLSGPLALDISGDISALCPCEVFIDFFPLSSVVSFREKFLDMLSVKGASQIKTLLEDFLPKRFCPVFLARFTVAPDKRCSQLTRHERDTLVSALRAFPLSVSGIFDISASMVTSGGVLFKEVDPRTMESRKIKGFYLAGELLEGYALSGGYNLQQAFSTGSLAGHCAAL